MYTLEQWVQLLGRELLLRRRAVFAVVVIINMAAFAAAWNWPEKYLSWTTIFVEERNIIEPLMQGAAVATGVTDRARIARELIHGRRVMHRLIEDLGWYGQDLPDARKDVLAEEIKGRMEINNVGRAGLIRIEYTDNDPMRAFQATRRIAELFIEESHEAKLRESRAAYEFISKQADEYHAKLQNAEQQLKEFRSRSVDLGAAGEAGISGRIGVIRGRLDQARQELREAEIRRASLESQLSGETETAFALSREGQYRTRMSELQSQLDALLLNYHDTHPDVVRVRHQIEDLQQAVQAEQQNRETSPQPAGGARSRQLIVHNPLYQQLRQDLSQTITLIDTSRARIQEAERQLELEVQRGRQVHGDEAMLAELTRDYEVNRTTYQDLSRRRESARVSMNLDEERQGLTFRLQEEAFVPSSPSSLRLLHIMLAGVALSILLPVGLLLAAIQFDGRIRLPQTIASGVKVPVLGVVPHLWPPRDARRFRREIGLGVAVLSLLIAGTAVVSLYSGFLE